MISVPESIKAKQPGLTGSEDFKAKEAKQHKASAAGK